MIQGALMFEWSYSLTTDHKAATTVRYICFSPPIRLKGRRGRDRMLVVFKMINSYIFNDSTLCLRNNVFYLF